MTDRTKLEVIAGGKIDPSDVDTSDEELESLAIRLGESLRIIDTLYQPAERSDQHILLLRDGIDLVKQQAEAEGQKTWPQIADESINAHLDKKSPTPLTEQYKSISQYLIDTLTALKRAVFENSAQLPIEFPSDAWHIPEVEDAIMQGRVYIDEILNLLVAAATEATPGDRLHQKIEYIDHACEQIAEQAKHPPLD